VMRTAQQSIVAVSSVRRRDRATGTKILDVFELGWLSRYGPLYLTKSRVSNPGRSKISFFSQQCADPALGSNQYPTKWVPGVTLPSVKRTINSFAHMPVEIHSGDTINPYPANVENRVS
jgi:hypothetical protein